MTLDLTNPAHEAALRSALAVRIHGPLTDKGREDCPILKASGIDIISACDLMKAAYATIDDPALASDLIRQLVERAGVSRCAFPYPGMDWMTCCRVKGHEGPHAHCLGNDGFECLSGECMTEDALGERCAPNPAIIARLLALPPNAGAEAVLRALRGET
jgi:hypothetical protein